MPDSVYLPLDDFDAGALNNSDVAADFLELTAFFAKEKYAPTQSIIDVLELQADDDFKTVEEKIARREEVASSAAMAIAVRKKSLSDAYPFRISKDGRVVRCCVDALDKGRAAYLVCLILSNLRAATPLLNGSARHSDEAGVRLLRQYFQYFATAAMAAEIGGPAWSFGFPRPDRSGFLAKLKEIWVVLKDGTVDPEEGEAPLCPKDSRIDVFAGRPHVDGLPVSCLQRRKSRLEWIGAKNPFAPIWTTYSFKGGSRGSRPRRRYPIM